MGTRYARKTKESSPFSDCRSALRLYSQYENGLVRLEFLVRQHFLDRMRHRGRREAAEHNDSDTNRNQSQGDDDQENAVHLATIGLRRRFGRFWLQRRAVC